MTSTPSGNPEGFVILDKSAGITSNKILGRIARALGNGTKVGHSGTLDSFATGILICLFGRYTRLSDYFLNAGKSYEALIALGSETDTLDPGGYVVAEAPLPSAEAFSAVLHQFRGDIQQTPPAFSSVHIDGERAYQRVMRGEEVSMPSRNVHIAELELLSFTGTHAKVRVACSKGTYMRSLARDLALACGSRGHLAALRRISSGPFTLTDAVDEESCTPDRFRTFDPAVASSLGLDVVYLDSGDARSFAHGLPPRKFPFFLARTSPAPFAAFTERGSFIGISQQVEGFWKYSVVLEGSSCE